MIDRRLVVYGTLAPGRENAHVLEHLGGTWTEVVIHGHLVASGWGFASGYPGIELDADGPAVPGWLLESSALERAWDELDHFEGSGYRRRAVRPSIDGVVGDEAWIYEICPLDEQPDVEGPSPVMR